MKKYSLKNNYLFAIQWDGTNEEEIEALTGLRANVRKNDVETWLWLYDLGGSLQQEVFKDDYVVRYQGGLIEVVLPETFEENYTEVINLPENILTQEELSLLQEILRDYKLKAEDNRLETDNLLTKIQTLISRKNVKL